MCSGSEAGSHLRLIDFVYHSTLGLSVINKKKKMRVHTGDYAVIIECAASSSKGS